MPIFLPPLPRLRLASVGIATLLLPLAAGCGHDPISSRRPSSAAEPFAQDRAVTPVTAVALAHGPAGGTLTLRLAVDLGVPRLALDPAPASGRAWTFQVAFDLDRDARTGDATGAERAVALVAPDRAAWLALEDGAWRRLGEGPVRRRGTGIEIGVPAGAFPAGRVPVAAVESYLVSASAPGEVALVPAGRSEFPALDGSERPVPTLQWMRASVRGDSLVLRAQLQPPGRETRYDPATPGGWMLQVFLNTDEAPSGYWEGYDYIVRGGEWNDGEFVVRRIQPGDQWPGGWGPPSGRAQFDPRTRSLTVTVPRGALGGDDCHLHYGLEFYETVPCDACPTGVSHHYVDHWVGATAFAPGTATVRPVAELDAGAPRYGISPPPSGTDAYAR